MDEFSRMTTYVEWHEFQTAHKRYGLEFTTWSGIHTYMVSVLTNVIEMLRANTKPEPKTDETANETVDETANETVDETSDQVSDEKTDEIAETYMIYMARLFHPTTIKLLKNTKIDEADSAHVDAVLQMTSTLNDYILYTKTGARREWKTQHFSVRLYAFLRYLNETMIQSVATQGLFQRLYAHLEYLDARLGGIPSWMRKKMFSAIYDGAASIAWSFVPNAVRPIVSAVANSALITSRQLGFEVLRGVAHWYMNTNTFGNNMMVDGLEKLFALASGNSKFDFFASLEATSNTKLPECVASILSVMAAFVTRKKLEWEANSRGLIDNLFPDHKSNSRFVQFGNMMESFLMWLVNLNFGVWFSGENRWTSILNSLKATLPMWVCIARWLLEGFITTRLGRLVQGNGGYFITNAILTAKWTLIGFGASGGGNTYEVLWMVLTASIHSFTTTTELRMRNCVAIDDAMLRSQELLKRGRQVDLTPYAIAQATLSDVNTAINQVLSPRRNVAMDKDPTLMANLLPLIPGTSNVMMAIQLTSLLYQVLAQLCQSGTWITRISSTTYQTLQVFLTNPRASFTVMKSTSRSQIDQMIRWLWNMRVWAEMTHNGCAHICPQYREFMDVKAWLATKPITESTGPTQQELRNAAQEELRDAMLALMRQNLPEGWKEKLESTNPPEDAFFSQCDDALCSNATEGVMTALHPTVGYKHLYATMKKTNFAFSEAFLDAYVKHKASLNSEDKAAYATKYVTEHINFIANHDVLGLATDLFSTFIPNIQDIALVANTLATRTAADSNITVKKAAQRVAMSLQTLKELRAALLNGDTKLTDYLAQDDPASTLIRRATQLHQERERILSFCGLTSQGAYDTQYQTIAAEKIMNELVRINNAADPNQRAFTTEELGQITEYTMNSLKSRAENYDPESWGDFLKAPDRIAHLLNLTRVDTNTNMPRTSTGGIDVLAAMRAILGNFTKITPEIASLSVHPKDGMSTKDFTDYTKQHQFDLYFLKLINALFGDNSYLPYFRTVLRRSKVYIQGITDDKKTLEKIDAGKTEIYAHDAKFRYSLATALVGWCARPDRTTVLPNPIMNSAYGKDIAVLCQSDVSTETRMQMLMKTVRNIVDQISDAGKITFASHRDLVKFINDGLTYAQAVYNAPFVAPNGINTTKPGNPNAVNSLSISLTEYLTPIWKSLEDGTFTHFANGLTLWGEQLAFGYKAARSNRASKPRRVK